MEIVENLFKDAIRKYNQEEHAEDNKKAGKKDDKKAAKKGGKEEI